MVSLSVGYDAAQEAAAANLKLIMGLGFTLCIEQNIPWAKGMPKSASKC